MQIDDGLPDDFVVRNIEVITAVHLVLGKRSGAPVTISMTSWRSVRLPVTSRPPAKRHFS